MSEQEQKKRAAEAALEYIKDHRVIGVGTGTTVHCFIEALASVKGRIDVAVASSVDTANRLKALGIDVQDLNAVGTIPVYIDSADEVNAHRVLIKGGGGALTREKIVAASSKQFVCIVNEHKKSGCVGYIPIGGGSHTHGARLCGTSNCKIRRQPGIP